MGIYRLSWLGWLLALAGAAVMVWCALFLIALFSPGYNQAKATVSTLLGPAPARAAVRNSRRTLQLLATPILTNKKGRTRITVDPSPAR